MFIICNYRRLFIEFVCNVKYFAKKHARARTHTHTHIHTHKTGNEVVQRCQTQANTISALCYIHPQAHARTHTHTHTRIIQKEDHSHEQIALKLKEEISEILNLESGILW
jgi:hypothetical protein